ncbi:unnamed protein product [Adineta ricciae]|uniref:DUF19 domain-containing protein n=1 Tax=Adineta ricciae TaxID=249248 RepID=A0A813V1T1_ADIRI|nr:unnamed protein product [Adineta ricciae]CAF1304105.1 unnamed protein product [Adineta ricciae]
MAAMIRLFLTCVFLATSVCGAKMSRAEIQSCYEKSKSLETACEFHQCFHERYQCNDESVTAWALELCRQFPKDVVLQFTPPGTKMMIDIANCTQNFLARIFQQRKTLNCNAFESKYFSTLTKCYANEKNFCDIFKTNRAIFMKQATAIMMKKPRALQAFAAAAKDCTRLN